MAFKTYLETIEYLFTQLPSYQKEGKNALNYKLDTITALCTLVGNPQHQFRAIHVAGTNGKGSVSHMLASILQEAGYVIGLYTSPHLKNFTERIRINGIEIPEQTVIEFVDKIKDNTLSPSFFEITVAMAFYHFAKQQVDIAIIEVGLGGRLDSTNIITPEVSVITTIGYDHTAILGNTLEEIAFEKAGIIKIGIPVVIGERKAETEDVFIKIAEEKNAPILFASDDTKPLYASDLKGNYQEKNQFTARTAIDVLNKTSSFTVSEEQVQNGLLHVTKNTGLKGRWQQLNDSPLTICDTAHNQQGLTAVIDQLLAIPHEQLHFILGFVDDKEVDIILELFPKEATYTFCEPPIKRAMEADAVLAVAKKKGLNGTVIMDVNKALKQVVEKVHPNDVVYVGGSTFVVAEIENL